jgi:ABC-type glycerol-3-phosphate transport system permease component
MGDTTLPTAAKPASRETASSAIRFTPKMLQNLFIYLILILGAFIALAPFFWMISKSLMTLGQAISSDLIPDEIVWTNYMEAWARGNFTEYFLNSIQITTITLAGELVFSVLAAYAFARIDFPGRGALFGMLLSTLMIPGMVYTIPNLLTVTWLSRVGPIEWINNWPALTIPFMGSVFSIFLLRQFFAQIPDELYDAARIDGAGHLRFLTQIVVPLSKAPIMVIIIFSFVGTWNALAWPLLVTSSDEWTPIAVGFYAFQAEAGQELNYMMAGAFITILPILLMYFFTQKQFTESIARSGLKG